MPDTAVPPPCAAPEHFGPTVEAGRPGSASDISVSEGADAALTAFL